MVLAIGSHIHRSPPPNTNTQDTQTHGATDKCIVSVLRTSNRYRHNRTLTQQTYTLSTCTPLLIYSFSKIILTRLEPTTRNSFVIFFITFFQDAYWLLRFTLLLIPSVTNNPLIRLLYLSSSTHSSQMHDFLRHPENGSKADKTQLAFTILEKERNKGLAAGTEERRIGSSCKTFGT